MAATNNNKRKGTWFAVLAAIVGVSAATMLYDEVPRHEGQVNRGYLDPVGIPTKCFGDTNDVVVGRRYTDEECLDSLGRQLVAHAGPVVRCTPAIRGNPKVITAVVSFAYNIGVHGYCNQSAAGRYFKRGDLEAGCRAIGNGSWTTARGKRLPGLVRRRQAEMRLCLEGLR